MSTEQGGLSGVAKRRGRPTEISQSAAALGAAKAFWRHGFEGASLDDLVDATGVSRPGLYRTFDDKKGLFLAAIDAYEEAVTAEAISAFEDEADIFSAVELFLSVSADNNTGPDTPSGCLLACCATTSAEEMPKVRERLVRSFNELQDRISARFKRETESGALSDFPAPEARARLLVDLMTAQAVRARSGESREVLASEHRSSCNFVLAGAHTFDLAGRC